MSVWKRALCAVIAIPLAVAGLCSVVVALIVIAWPATNSPSGKADDWQISTPYIVAAVVLFAASTFVMWLGFRRNKSSRDQKSDS